MPPNFELAVDAIVSGDKDTLERLLLDRGAPLEVLNCYGGTILDQALWSAHNGEPEIDFVPVIELLLAAGAKD